MIGYLEKERFIDSGIAYPFKTHLQETYGASTVVEVHYHQHIEILYCLSGSFRVFIGTKIDYFSEGDMVVINAMEAHAIFALAEGHGAYLVIRFEPEFLYTSVHAIFETKYILPFTVSHADHQRIIRAQTMVGTQVPYWLLEIAKEDQLRGYGFELAIKTHLGAIFLWMLRRWHQEGAEVGVSESVNVTTISHLQAALDYVARHWEEPLRLKDMAKRCNLSESYFSRTFKQVVGKSFSDYVNFVRLSRAQQFLMSTDWSITEVAMASGFSTASYFIDLFKRQYQQTPLQFRRHFSVCWEKEGL